MTDRSAEAIVTQALTKFAGYRRVRLPDGSDAYLSTFAPSVVAALRQAGLLLDPGEWEQVGWGVPTSSNPNSIHGRQVASGMYFGFSLADECARERVYPDAEPVYRRRPLEPSNG